MKLRTLRLHGFKSFADRTELDFREGVTAIIGSNGCGKSNIADAVRWVLGEQRASAIRGAKMEEVIFQGTTRRRPLNFAEVSLLFDNEKGRVPVPQSEIEVSRKVFREGGSEYALNRNACRLRDVHNLLRDTGLGSNAYAIIEAGMIETLLSDRAEERRALFEEAAGIGRYKDSRRSASRRLEAAEGDLARLDDLIAEVESKVRSLARQKRKAERHRELQAQRLDLEVTLALFESTTLSEELRGGVQRHAALEEELRSASAERSTAEATAEERRVEAARLAQERTAVAARLDLVRRELDAREREVLLADERRSHAEMRIQQLVRERAEVEQRQAALLAEQRQGAAERERAGQTLATLRERLEERAEENQAVRSAVAAERERSETAAARARELAREIATAEGERAAAERRHRDALERLGQAEAQVVELRGRLAASAEQTELWSAQAEETRARLAAADEALAEARERVAVRRAREQEAREAYLAAEDHLSRLSAQLDARDALERSYEGFSPAVASLMAERSRFPGVLGPLADFVPAAGAPGHAAAVERYLGPLLQAVVVADLTAARVVRSWFREEWTGGGSLVLLPLDAPGRAAAAGAGLAESLLAELVVVDSDPLAEYSAGVARVGRDGDVLDARGVVRLGEVGTGEGILARREALVHLRAERATAERERDALRAVRDELRQELEEAEEGVVAAGELRRVAENELGRIELDAAAHRHQRSRLEGDERAAEQALASLRQTRDAAATQIQALQARLEELTRAVDDAAGEDAIARARLLELEGRWEEARDQESELRVAVARAEADLREAERRLSAAEQGGGAAATRLATIEREAVELRETLDGLAGVRERAGGEIQALFEARDREAAALAHVDTRIVEVEEAVAAAGERARVARRRETEASEERHRLELRNADLRSRLERVRERLEVEWGRTWEALVGDSNPLEEGDAERWRAELRDTTVQLDALGPVNMLAVEEHAEEDRRLNFLLEQRADLVKARDDLVAAIRQINKTAREVFTETFDAVRENFQRVFQSLFQGGECDVWLTDPDDPLESPVEIQASPKGKKTQRIHLLSGGERTLTALALLFALYLVKPSPFCVLDEVDAPLDESNVGRFIQLLQDFKSDTQFIVITHNPRTMEAADWVYGVTMEEPGVSTIVGVELLGAWALEGKSAVNT